MEKTAFYYFALTTALFLMLLLSLFFSLCETSFSSLNRIKLKMMAGKKKYRKAALLSMKLLEQYDKLLSAVLIGNTIVNIAASAIAAMLFYILFGAKGVSLAAAALTVIVLVFCEISPKTLAKESPEQTAMSVSPLLHFFIIILSPLNFLTASLKKLLIKLFPPKADRHATDEELLTFVGEMQKEGGINKHEEKKISIMLKLSIFKKAKRKI